MIPKENIEEITDLFKRNFWLVYIPFAIYFVSSVYDINQIKNDIDKIQLIVKNDANKKFDSLVSNFKQYSFLIKNRHQRDNLYEHINASITSLRLNEFEASIGWENEIEKIIAYNTGLLKRSMTYFENERTLIEVDQFLFDVCSGFPELRGYFSYILAEYIVNIFKGISFGSSSSCCFNCAYFNPVLQRFGENYFVYSDLKNEYHSGRRAEIKVNGKRIWGNSYVFHPKRKGLHRLDIEYKFWGQHGLQTLNFKKGLMVK